MKGLFYRCLILLADIFGSWIFVAVSRVIACGYFLFSGRAAESRRFYGIMYPERGRLYHLLCTFKQYQNFTTVYFDRLLAKDRGEISFTSEGGENLRRAIDGEGGVLLMSHLGNWELAAHLLPARYDRLRLLLYMGIKEKEEIEKIQKQSLRQSGIKIIGVNKDGGSPFDVVEGFRFIRAGGLVSLSGDIVWQQEQRTVRVKFLNHYARLPEAPFVFALVSGAPLYIFFTFGGRKSRYHFTLSKPIYIRAASRAGRREAISRAAQKYADLLEETLRRHPFEWYHFERFIGEKTSLPSERSAIF
ncbi:MAG TPA: lauroyl acyltransferase [Desulfobacterales bacterium]|nr:lauroyl acyltransferase [Desulfobacterales bacterium]